MKRYFYNGPVMVFGVCVCDRWHGETTAASPEKARSNLTYQYKKCTGRTADTHVTLTGKITAVE